MPSFLVSLQDKKNIDYTSKVGKLEEIVKAVTVVGEIVLYTYLARKGIPAYAVPTLTNIVDIAGYLSDKFAQLKNDYGLPWIGEPFPDIDWNSGGVWRRIFPRLYRNL